jgi:hypothetical protein
MAQITLNSTGVASDGALALQSNGTTTAVTISTAQNVGIGTASPARLLSLSAASPILRMTETGANSDLDFIVSTNSGGLNISVDANNEGANSFCAVSVDGTERMRINSSGNVGVGTSSPLGRLDVQTGTGDDSANSTLTIRSSGNQRLDFYNNWSTATGVRARIESDADDISQSYGTLKFYTTQNNTVGVTERMRITSGGNLLVGKTAVSNATVGSMFIDPATTDHYFSVVNTASNSAARLLFLNRQSSDGDLIQFLQANTQEGSISVSGTTVTYGGGHLARFGQLPDGSEDQTLLKGTVLTNLDEMCVWINKETGIPADNEQCNKVKISDVDGDANVAGVFVSWSYDEQHDTNDLFVAMTGDMIIRIAQGVTVARGDLLMSAGDGTAKPQGDDIIRSKTVAKVTSTHVTCTYADGSYCVPCVLMAC